MPESPDESKALAHSFCAAGISATVPGRIAATRTVGRYVSGQGEVDYAIGLITEQIEILRTYQQTLDLMVQNTTDSKRQEAMHRDRAEASGRIALLTKQLLEAAKVSGERKNDKGKPRAQSFRPGEQITVVEVDPNDAAGKAE